MITLKQFVENVKNGVLSDYAPIEEMVDYNSFERPNDLLSSFRAREECTKRGMWAVVDKHWTKELAKWIGNRKCLEVMAGAGWLAKALDFYKVDIIATDDHLWKNGRHKEMKVVYPVEELDGLEAVKKYSDRDILIVSWPPYNEKAICSICDKWGNGKPIVYIGEDYEGCCATDLFFKNFKRSEEQPNIKIPQWWGLHDYLTIGYWNKVKAKVKRVDNAIKELELEDA